MRVLIVAPYFPPYKSVGALRMASLARYLLLHGIETDILTNTVDGEAEIEATYHYVDIKNTGEKYYTRFKRNQMEYCEAFRKVCGNRHPDVVIVSGGPFYTFRIAQYAKESGLPCILDFRDPWIFEYRGAKSFFTVRNLISKFIELPWEREAVHAATCVVTVTDGWKKNFEKAYPFSKSKFMVIENGYDDALLQSISLDAPRHSKKITLAAFGKLFYYTQEYSKVFLNAYRKLQDRVDLMQIGQKETKSDELLTNCGISLDKLYATGFLNYQEGIKQLNQADAFLLIDSRRNAIGTKIYDYIYLNKPIIYVGPKRTVLAQIISRFENGFVCSSEQETEEALNNIKSGMRLDEHIDISKYSRSAQNQNWLEMICGLVGE